MVNDIQQALINESRVVWLVPLDDLPRYVRESVVSLPRRRGMSHRSRRLHPGTVVGYTELGHEAPSDECHEFTRRVFWLKAHDPYEHEWNAPMEAVDPRQVQAGRESEDYAP